MSTSPLLIERSALGSGCVERWTLNAPDSRNALTAAAVDALRAACARAQTDTDLRAIVLQGAGGHFCAGGSLGDFVSAIGQPWQGAASADPLATLNREYGALLEALTALPQWLLAAVDGAAMGGGIGLLCCADFVLATPQAVFATPEVTLGIVPAQIAPFVVRRLGDAAARDWLLQGQRWSAKEAIRAGLVNALAEGPLADAVLERLRTVALAAPAAVAATKQLLLSRQVLPLPALLDAAALSFASSLRGTEAPQGLGAFAKRQPAPWSVE
ncbi:MAG: enoyl-CoA hydratase/isomerase family protein [Burkholderiaceae bacterium]|nr:enoyl-CoA hydratase/isomerase family protein [Burkholderiaceae bacterium]